MKRSTFLPVLAACFILFSGSVIAGWEISGSPSHVHQRIVHEAKVHPRKPVVQKTVHRHKRTYKDYLSKQDQERIVNKEREPYFESEREKPVAMRAAEPLRPAPVPVRRSHYPVDSGGLYAITINGSLKDNMTRIMSRYNWKVAWKVPYDYNFDGRVTGSSLPNVIEKLIKPFPLRAEMYMANRTLAVVPKERIS